MDRFEKIFSKVSSEADCLLITSDINRRYFTGMKSSAGTILCFKDTAYLIIDFRYIEKARNTVKNCEVIEQDKLFVQIDELMKKHHARTIAVEARDMTLYNLGIYKEKLPMYEFCTSDNLSKAIYDLRTIKEQFEIDKIKTAQRIAETAFDEILNFIRVGRTEREVSIMLDKIMMENGAEGISFETIALSGENTSMPHGVPSNRQIQNGDFILMDFGAVYDGYHSDMTRTVCIGTPEDEMDDVYNIVLDAQLKALNSLHAGITGSDLDESARQVIEYAGYGDCFGHSLGHGVGLEIHEFPTASKNSLGILEENMIVTVEPGIYIADKFGVRIEDLVVVTKNSYENLTKSPKKLICL